MKFAATIVVMACLASIAEDPPQIKKDAQSSFEPRTGPGAGQKFLEKFVGDWTVTKSFYPRTGEPVRASGECRQTMIHDGRFLQSEFVFGQADKKTTGLGLIGFEPDTGLFTSVWTDSRQTGISLRKSKDKFDGEKIVLFSRSLEPESKDARRSRTVTELRENGGQIVHRQYAISPDGSERLMMELIMVRQSATAPAKK